MNWFAATIVLFASAALGQGGKTPICNARKITLTTDAQNGYFDRTSHSGTLLVMHNHGRAACSILPKPQFDFNDASGHHLALSWAVPPGMHPGPVQVPVDIPPGGVATARTSWVSNEVYDQNTCIDPSTISLYFGKFDGGTLKAPLAAHICGPAGKPVTYILEPFHPDPTYKPSASR